MCFMLDHDPRPGQGFALVMESPNSDVTCVHTLTPAEFRALWFHCLSHLHVSSALSLSRHGYAEVVLRNKVGKSLYYFLLFLLFGMAPDPPSPPRSDRSPRAVSHSQLHG